MSPQSTAAIPFSLCWFSCAGPSTTSRGELISIWNSWLSLLLCHCTACRPLLPQRSAGRALRGRCPELAFWRVSHSLAHGAATKQLLRCLLGEQRCEHASSQACCGPCCCACIWCTHVSAVSRLESSMADCCLYLHGWFFAWALRFC
jgi:hypothetical protein